MRNVHVCNIGSAVSMGKNYLDTCHSITNTKDLRNTETLTELTMSQWSSSGIFSQDSTRCSSVKKSKVYCWDWVRHQRISQEELYSCRCSTTSPVDQKTMKKNTSPMLNSFFYVRKDLNQDDGHFSVLVKRKSGILSVQIVHKVNGTESLN